jgi:hypothetical protein
MLSSTLSFAIAKSPSSAERSEAGIRLVELSCDMSRPLQWRQCSRWMSSAQRSQPCSKAKAGWATREGGLRL